MTSIVVFLVGVVASWLITRAALGAARIYQRSYEERRIAADEFYEIADRIIDHPEAEPDDIRTVGNMNDVINQPHAAMALGMVLYRRRYVKRNGKARSTPSPEVGELLLLAYDKWFAAITARSPYFGSFARLMRAQQEMRPTVREAAKKVQSERTRRLAHA
jgi:hypothetical protein